MMRDMNVSRIYTVQATKVFKSTSEGSSLNSSLWVQRIGSHVEVLSKGLIDQSLVLSISIVVLNSVIEILNGSRSPARMFCQIESFKINVFMIKSKVFYGLVL